MEAVPSNNQFGRYELTQLIAVGGMGEIWLARMKGAANFEKRCVIKKILPHLAQEEEFVTKFIDEANIVVQLTHGNIVPVFDMGEQEGQFYIAMDYIPGSDVRSILKARKAANSTLLPVPICVSIAAEVCKGLAYAHRKTDDDGNPLDIIHRDVSPSNIIISVDGEVKLVDFGIAKASSRSSRSITGRLQGKFGYMSPEQARGADLDGRSDIFSTGVVLYELLTGERPFHGDNDLDSLEKVKSHAPTAPGELRNEIPTELDEIVLKALAKDPDDRFDNAEEFLDVLMKFLVGTGEHVTPSAVASALEDELHEVGHNGATAKGARFEDLLDLEADRLLANDGSTQTGTISAPESGLALQRTATMDSDQSIQPVTAEPEDGDESSIEQSAAKDAGDGTAQNDGLAGNPGSSSRDEAPDSPAGEVLATPASTEAPPPPETSGRWALVGLALLAAAIVAAVLLLTSESPNGEAAPVRGTGAAEEDPGTTTENQEAPSTNVEEPEHLESPGPPEIETRLVGLLIQPEDVDAEVTVADQDMQVMEPATVYEVGLDQTLELTITAKEHRTCRLELTLNPLETSSEYCDATVRDGDKENQLQLTASLEPVPPIVKVGPNGENSGESVGDNGENAGDDGGKGNGGEERDRPKRRRDVDYTVVTDIPGVIVTVDGETLAGPPFTFEKDGDAEPFKVSVSAPGYWTWKKTVDPSKDRGDVKLDPGHASWPRLRIKVIGEDEGGGIVSKATTIRVNGRRVGKNVGSVDIFVPPGAFDVQAEHSEFAVAGESSVKVSANEGDARLMVQMTRQE